MTSTELAAYTGRKGLWTPASAALQVEVVTIDARSGYGRIDVRIKPVAGTGEAWVDSKSVKLEAASAK